MSTYSSPADILPNTKASSGTINNLDAAIASAFALLPTEANLTRGTTNYAVDTGTVNALVVTLPHTPSGWVDGLVIDVKPAFTNTSTTVTVDLGGALGSKQVKNQNNALLALSDIVVGVPVKLVYSTTTGAAHIMRGATGAPGTVDAASLALTTNNAASKTPIVNADEFPITDSAASYGLKKLTWANLKASLVATALSWAGIQTFSNAVNMSRATVASHATTADIWGAAGNQIDWTGTATTTAFPNAPQSGVKRTLVCAGACSFTAGANLLIAGVSSGNTVTCAANDKVIVEAISTTQFHLTRQKYDGTAQVVNVPGSMVYLSTVTASAASTADIETTFDSTYDEYWIIAESIKPSVDGATINLRMKLSGAYVTTNDYGWTRVQITTASSVVSGGASSAATEIRFIDKIGNAATKYGWGIIKIKTPSGSNIKALQYESSAFIDTAGTLDAYFGSGFNAGTGALTGIRFLPSSGTFSGTFRLYGIRNS
jgi:hypothetical protein